MAFRKTMHFFLFFLALFAPMVARAQQVGATVRGQVADPDNAVIPGATVTLTPASGKAMTTQSQSDGTYVLRGVPAGTYSITVTMQGFATFVRQGVRITAGQALTQDAKMAIQEQSQTVQVTASSAQVGVDPDNNASSTVIKGKDLDALSDDPDELSSELTALAGPAAGPNGGQIYIDGFTGDNFRRSRRFARFVLIKIPSLRSTTNWVMVGSRCLPSPVPINSMDSSICRGSITRLTRGTHC
jgi:hypothetical protein